MVLHCSYLFVTNFSLDEDSDFSLGDEEIEALLDKDIAKKPADVQVPHTEKIKVCSWLVLE